MDEDRHVYDEQAIEMFREVMGARRYTGVEEPAAEMMIRWALEHRLAASHELDRKRQLRFRLWNDDGRSVLCLNPQIEAKAPPDVAVEKKHWLYRKSPSLLHRNEELNERLSQVPAWAWDRDPSEHSFPKIPLFALDSPVVSEPLFEALEWIVEELRRSPRNAR